MDNQINSSNGRANVGPTVKLFGVSISTTSMHINGQSELPPTQPTAPNNTLRLLGTTIVLDNPSNRASPQHGHGFGQSPGTGSASRGFVSQDVSAGVVNDFGQANPSGFDDVVLSPDPIQVFDPFNTVLAPPQEVIEINSSSEEQEEDDYGDVEMIDVQVTDTVVEVEAMFLNFVDEVIIALVQMGRSLQGLNAFQISQALTIYMYNEAERNPDMDVCTVCWENFCDGDDVADIQFCTHLFHARCIMPWLRLANRCPNCNGVAFVPLLSR